MHTAYVTKKPTALHIYIWKHFKALHTYCIKKVYVCNKSEIRPFMFST